MKSVKEVPHSYAQHMLDVLADEVAYNVVAEFSKPGSYGPLIGKKRIYGNVRISSSKIRLQNIIVYGKIFIEAKLNELVFERLNVHGKIVVRNEGIKIKFLDTYAKGITLEASPDAETNLYLDTKSHVHLLEAHHAACVTGQGMVEKFLSDGAIVTFEKEPKSSIIADHESPVRHDPLPKHEFVLGHELLSEPEPFFDPEPISGHELLSEVNEFTTFIPAITHPSSTTSSISPPSESLIEFLVEKAEQEKTREDYQNAKEKVAELAAGEFKDYLSDRLQLVLAWMQVQQLRQAKEAVERLFNPSGQVELDITVDHIKQAELKAGELNKNIPARQEFLDKINAAAEVIALRHEVSGMFVDDAHTEVHATVTLADISMLEKKNTWNDEKLLSLLDKARFFILKDQDLEIASEMIDELYIDPQHSKLNSAITWNKIQKTAAFIHEISDKIPQKAYFLEASQKAEQLYQNVTLTSPVWKKLKKLYWDESKNILGVAVAEKTIEQARQEISTFPEGVEKELLQHELEHLESLPMMIYQYASFEGRIFDQKKSDFGFKITAIQNTDLPIHFRIKIIFSQKRDDGLGEMPLINQNIWYQEKSYITDDQGAIYLDPENGILLSSFSLQKKLTFNLSTTFLDPGKVTMKIIPVLADQLEQVAFQPAIKNFNVFSGEKIRAADLLDVLFTDEDRTKIKKTITQMDLIYVKQEAKKLKFSESVEEELIAYIRKAEEQWVLIELGKLFTDASHQQLASGVTLQWIRELEQMIKSLGSEDQFLYLEWIEDAVKLAQAKRPQVPQMKLEDTFFKFEDEKIPELIYEDAVSLEDQDIYPIKQMESLDVHQDSAHATEVMTQLIFALSNMKHPSFTLLLEAREKVEQLPNYIPEKTQLMRQLQFLMERESSTVQTF